MASFFSYSERNIARNNMKLKTIYQYNTCKQTQNERRKAT